ncbi:hypothetical protein [Psychroserpens sp. MEBiC05023]
MNDLLKNHFFWKYVVRYTSIFSETNETLFRDLNSLVRYSYAAFLILAFGHLFNVNDIATSRLVEPLWPVFFLTQDNLLFTTFFLQISLLVSLVFVVIKNTSFLRIYVFVNYLLYAALLSSFGKINHGLHFILIPLFCFALLPNASHTYFKEKTALMYLSAKFFLLLAYTLTGFWKLFWGIIELFTKDVSLFSPLSFRNILVLQYEVTPITVFGSWFMEHYVLGWILYLLVIYLEFFSITIFFKPNLYKVWGAALVFMKLGLALILDVNNYIAICAIGILLLLSPFYRETNVKQTFLSLPVVDWFAYISKRKSIER